MRFLRALLVLAVALPLAAQEKSTAVRKIFEVKYADMFQIDRALKTFVGQYALTVDRNARMVYISAPDSIVAVVEDTLKRLDVPEAAPKNVELTAYFLGASEKESSEGGAIPADLQPVVKQLQTTFAFKNYRLLDSLLLRTRTGQSAETSGNLTGGRMPTLTVFKIREATVATTEKGRVIRLDALRVGLRVPTTSPSGGAVIYLDTGINGTDIDVAEGQKVVIGKSSMEGPGNALILVLTAKVL